MAKAILYFTLVALLVSVASSEFDEGDFCDPADPKYYGEYAPHPVYCYRFLQCVHNRFVGRNCSPGLHWNQEEGACDHPVNVGCTGLTTQRSTTTTTQATTTTQSTTTTYYPTTTTEYYTTTYDPTYTPTYPESYEVNGYKIINY